jgi:hypothetical protein
MRIIDADALPIDSIDMSNMIEVTDRGIAVVRLEDIIDAPTIKTKEIKYFDESENVWKIGRVIVDEVLGL